MRYLRSAFTWGLPRRLSDYDAGCYTRARSGRCSYRTCRPAPAIQRNHLQFNPSRKEPNRSWQQHTTEKRTAAYLNFNVARIIDKLLDQHSVITEARRSLLLRQAESLSNSKLHFIQSVAVTNHGSLYEQDLFRSNVDVKVTIDLNWRRRVVVLRE